MNWKGEGANVPKYCALFQRAYISKEEAASPPVSTEFTFIMASIPASKRRAVQYYNIPSAFVNIDVDKDVLMVLNGELADMMVQIALQIYRKYVTMDRKGKRILYMNLQKALYGLMRASLFFYRKLRKEFEYGLRVNPYNPCVANMTTKSGKQLTVVWHVEDLIGLCKENFELTKSLGYLGKIYGQKLRMHMGKRHDYLGVVMEFTNKETLDISIVTYLKNAIAGSPKEIRGKAASPAADHLFLVRDLIGTKALEEERALAFHHTVAQLLFMCTRARRDIQTAVAFLTTSVKEPDEDNCGKLKRVLKILNRTTYLKLKLSVENLGMLKYYVDGSHNVHADCRGHGGAVFMKGKRATTSYSRKVNLNMQRPEMLWSLHFIQEQGYETECIELYQDNISTQLLIKSGQMLSDKKMKYIIENFFFIKDRVMTGR
jgi:hypothetical protein